MRPSAPVLRFSPAAWVKLLLLRGRGDAEAGGVGISTRADLLRVEDVQLVRHTCSITRARSDAAPAVGSFDRQADHGDSPQHIARIWVQTHRGDCPRPSGTDEETFAQVFGDAEWAVMFILARGGRTYARLRFNVGPGGQMRIPVEIDFHGRPVGSNAAAPEQERLAQVPSGFRPHSGVMPRHDPDQQIPSEPGDRPDLDANDRAPAGERLVA